MSAKLALLLTQVAALLADGTITVEELTRALQEPAREEDPRELLDGWYSPEHVHFYNQAIRQANSILKQAARGGDE